MGSKTEGTKTRWAEIKGVQRVKEAELRLGYSDGGGRSCGGACGGVVWVTERNENSHRNKESENVGLVRKIS